MASWKLTQNVSNRKWIEVEMTSRMGPSPRVQTKFVSCCLVSWLERTRKKVVTVSCVAKSPQMIFFQLIDVYTVYKRRRGLFISNVFSAVLARLVTLIANLGRFIYLYTKGSRRLMWIARLYRLHSQKIHSKSVTRKATICCCCCCWPSSIVGLFRPPFIDLPAAQQRDG
jgi:hypothetical protein